MIQPRIPFMENAEIMRYYERIKPIVPRSQGDSYLTELNEHAVTSYAFNKIEEGEETEVLVDYSELATLADVKMIHGWGYHIYFKPSVAEVIRQIPKDLLDKTVAFTLIWGSTTSLFKEEFDAGYHPSIIRLFKKREDGEPAADQDSMEFDENFKKPLGISDEDFEKLRKFRFGE